MIHIQVKKKRWDNLIDSLLQLGYGRVDQQLEITGNNDEFEGVEALFNMMCEELKHRLLHLSFTKPAAFQRYLNHFIIITDKEFKIKSMCEHLVTHYQLNVNQLKDRSFLNLIEKESGDQFAVAYRSSKEEFEKVHRLTVFNDSFSVCIKTMKSGLLIINLYQLHMDIKDIQVPYKKRIKQKAKLVQKKRNEDLLEQFKEDVSKYPLSKKLPLEELYLKYPTNKGMLKKLFRQQYQCGAYEYHLRLRMNYAYAQIAHTEVPFKEIALDVGYANYQAFVKSFKNYFSMLPREIRNQGQYSEKSETEED